MERFGQAHSGENMSGFVWLDGTFGVSFLLMMDPALTYSERIVDFHILFSHRILKRFQSREVCLLCDKLDVRNILVTNRPSYGIQTVQRYRATRQAWM